MRGRDGEEEAAVGGSRDGEVEEAEKGLVGEVPFLLGDPWVDDDSWIVLKDSCVLRGDWDKPGDWDLLEEGSSLLEGDCSRGFDRPGGLAGLEDVLGSSGKLENS